MCGPWSTHPWPAEEGYFARHIWGCCNSDVSKRLQRQLESDTPRPTLPQRDCPKVKDFAAHISDRGWFARWLSERPLLADVNYPHHQPSSADSRPSVLVTEPERKLCALSPPVGQVCSIKVGNCAVVLARKYALWTRISFGP